MTNLETAKGTLGEITNIIENIRGDNVLSDSGKKIKFNEFLDELPDSNQFKEVAKGFDILKDSTDVFAKESLVDLYDSEIKSSNGFFGMKSAIETYNSACGESAKKGQLVAQAIKRQNSMLGDYLIKQEGATTSAFDYGAQLVAMKAKALAARVGIMALNTAISIGVSLIISAALSAFSELYVSAEEAAEAAEELKSNFESATSAIKSNLDTVESVSDEFKNLSKGVDEYGNNIGLTTEEYKRYKEIVEQLVDINPDLLEGYDSEHNAIIKKNDAIKKTIELLKKQQKLEYKDYTSDDSLKTLTDGMEESVEELQDKYEEYADKRGRIQEVTLQGVQQLEAKIGNDFKYDSVFDKYSDMSNEEFIENFRDFKEDYMALIDYVNSQSNLVSGEDFIDADDIEESLSELRDFIYTDYPDLLDEINDKSKELNSTLQMIPATMDEYEKLSDKQKSFLTSYIDSFKLDISADTDEDDWYKQIKKQKDIIKDLVKTMPDDINLTIGINTAIDIDTTKTTVEEYQKKVKEAVNLIKNSDFAKNNNLSENEIKVMLGFSFETNEGEIKDSVDNYKTMLKNRLSEDFAFSDNEINIELNKLTVEQLKELSEVSDFSNFTNLSDAIRSVLKTAENQESLTTLKSNLEEFKSETFNDVNKGAESFNSALKKLNNDESLTGDEMLNLIALNADLAGSFTETKDGFVIDSKTLLSARKEYLSKTIELIQAEIEANNALSESLNNQKTNQESQLKSITEKKISAINQLQNAVANNQDPTKIVETISGYDEEISKLKTDMKETDSNIEDCNKQSKMWSTYLDVINKTTSDIDENTESTAKNLDPVNDYLKLQHNKIDKIVDGLEDEKNVEKNILDDMQKHKDKLEEQKELLQGQKEELEKQKELVEDIISDYETAANTVDTFIDKKIDELNDRKEELEKALDEQIESTQNRYDEEIEKLQQKNDEINRSIELTKKEDDLYNARRTKVRVYSEGSGWNVESDKQDIKQKEQELQQLRLSYQIDDLQSEKDKAVKALEDRKENDPEIKKLENEIEAYQKYKEEFQNMVDSYKAQQNELTTARILGADWHERVLNREAALITSYGSQYTAYQTQLNVDIAKEIEAKDKAIEEMDNVIAKQDEAMEKQQEIIDAKEVEIQSWNDYKEELSDVVDEITEKDEDYLKSVDTVVLTEKSSYEDRLAALAEFKRKELALKALGEGATEEEIYSVFNGNGNYNTSNQNKSKTTASYSQKGSGGYSGVSYVQNNDKKHGYKLYYVDSKNNSHELYRGSDLNTANYRKQTYVSQWKNISPKSSWWSKELGIRLDKNTPKSSIEGILKQKLRIEPYSKGGVIDYTGLANVHGTKQHSEVAFNSEQAKQLYEMIRNTDDLSAMIANNISDNVAKTISNHIQSQVIDVTSAKNDTPVQTKVIHAHFHNPVIQADNQESFDRCMENYLTRATLDVWVGK